MNKITAAIVLGVSLLVSSWIYWGSGSKLEQILTAKEWQSNLYTYVHVEPAMAERFGEINKVHLNSNVKYLPNATYVRVSRVSLIDASAENVVSIDISETGTWEMSDNYLLLNPIAFKDSAVIGAHEFNEEQLGLITQAFRNDAQQSRRVDIINNNSILLTSLGYGSQVLVSSQL